MNLWWYIGHHCQSTASQARSKNLAASLDVASLVKHHFSAELQIYLWANNHLTALKGCLIMKC